MADDNEILLRLGFDLAEFQRQLDGIAGQVSSTLNRVLTQVSTNVKSAVSTKSGAGQTGAIPVLSKDVKDLITKLIGLRNQQKDTFNDLTKDLEKTAGKSSKAQKEVENFVKGFDGLTKKITDLQELEQTISKIGDNELISPQLAARLEEVGISIKSIADALTQARVADDKMLDAAVKTESRINQIVGKESVDVAEKARLKRLDIQDKELKEVAKAELAKEREREKAAVRQAALDKKISDKKLDTQDKELKEVAKAELAKEREREKAAVRQAALDKKISDKRLDIQDKELKEVAKAELKKLRESELQVNRFVKGLAFNVGILGFGLGILGGHLTRIGQTLFQWGQNVTQSTADIDQLRAALEGVTGSAGEANKQFEELKILARRPGITFEGAVRGAVQLQQQNFNFEQAKKIVAEYGNAIALAGGKQEDLNEVIEQTRQILASPTLELQDVKSLVKRFAGSNEALKAAFGTASIEEIRKQIESGELTKQGFVLGFVEALSKQRRAPENFANTLKNLNDSAARMGAVLGNVVAPALKSIGNLVTNTIEPALAGLQKRFDALPEGVKQIISFAVLLVPVIAIVLGGLLGILSALALIVSQVAQFEKLFVGLRQVLRAGGVGSLLGTVAGTEGAAEAAGVIGRIVSGASKLVPILGQIVLLITIVVEALPQIGEGFASIGDAVSSLFEVLGVNFKWLDFLKAIVQVIAGIIAVIGSLIGVVATVLATISNVVTGSIAIVIKTVADFIKVIKGEISITDFVNNILLNILSLVVRVGVRIFQAIGRVVAAIISIFDTNAAARMNKWITETGDKLIAEFDTIGENAKKAQTGVKALNKEFESSSPEEYAAKVKEASDSLKELLTNLEETNAEFEKVKISGIQKASLDNIASTIKAFERQIDAALAVNNLTFANQLKNQLSAFVESLKGEGEVFRNEIASFYIDLASELTKQLRDPNSLLAKVTKESGTVFLNLLEPGDLATVAPQFVPKLLNELQRIKAQLEEKIRQTPTDTKAIAQATIVEDILKKANTARINARTAADAEYIRQRDNFLNVQKKIDDKERELKERGADAAIKAEEIATQKEIDNLKNKIDALEILRKRGIKDEESFLKEKAELQKDLIDLELARDVAEKQRRAKATDLQEEKDVLDKEIKQMRQRADEQKKAIDKAVGIEAIEATQRVRNMRFELDALKTDLQKEGFDLLLPSLFQFAFAIRSIANAAESVKEVGIVDVSKLIDKSQLEKMKELLSKVGFTPEGISIVADFFGKITEGEITTEGIDESIRKFIEDIANASVSELNQQVDKKKTEVFDILEKILKVDDPDLVTTRDEFLKKVKTAFPDLLSKLRSLSVQSLKVLANELRDNRSLVSEETALQIDILLAEIDKLMFEAENKRKQTTEDITKEFLDLLQTNLSAPIIQQLNELNNQRLELEAKYADASVFLEEKKYKEIQAKIINGEAQLKDLEAVFRAQALLADERNKDFRLQILKNLTEERKTILLEAQKELNRLGLAGDLGVATPSKPLPTAAPDSTDINKTAPNIETTTDKIKKNLEKFKNDVIGIFKDINNGIRGLLDIFNQLLQEKLNEALLKLKNFSKLAGFTAKAGAILTASGLLALSAAFEPVVNTISQALNKLVEEGKFSFKEFRKILGQALVSQGTYLLALAATLEIFAFIHGLITGGLIAALAEAAAVAPFAASAAIAGGALVAAGLAFGAGTGATTTSASNTAGASVGAVGSNTTTGTYDPNKDPRILYQQGIAAQITIDIRRDDASMVKTLINSLNTNTRLSRLIDNRRIVYNISG